MAGCKVLRCNSGESCPVQGQLDPLKEIRAAIFAIDRGIKTHEQVTREMGGGDWEENIEQLRRENELLAQAGGGTLEASGLGPGAGDGGDGDDGGEGGE